MIFLRPYPFVRFEISTPNGHKDKMWFVTLTIILLAVVSSLAVVNRYFSFKLHKNTFPLTLTILSVNMVLLLSTAYLLPLDIYYAAKANGPGEAVPPVNNGTTEVQLRVYAQASGAAAPVEQVPDLRVAWLFVYWIEFVLCWFILPVLISYCTLKYSCSRQQQQQHEGFQNQRSHVWERMLRAVYQNLKFYSLCLLGLIVGMIYLVVSTGHGLSEFKPLLISLSHLYSLSYTLILLSTGLIIFPKNLLSIGRSPSNEAVNKLFVELSKSNDDLNDSQLNMLENADRILNSPESNNGDVIFNQMLNECKMEVQSLLNEQELSINHHISGSLGSSPSISTLDKLNSHYNKFMTHYYNFLYSKTHSNSIIHLLAQSQSLRGSASTSLLGVFGNVTILSLGILATILSVLIIFLEITPTTWGHDIIFEGTRWYNLALEFIIFGYNTLVSLFAMSKFKFNNFHLISNGKSNPTNALYYSLYSSRLLFPLCFNLMVLMPSRTTDNSDFVKSNFETTLYDKLAVIPLVNFLNKYLPILFITFTAISYKFDLKQKVLLKILGEEYYYQFFGMMMYEPVPKNDAALNNETGPTSFLPDRETFNNRSPMDEDYEYSLQDGRYLFERASAASSNYVMSINNDSASVESNTHSTYL